VPAWLPTDDVISEHPDRQVLVVGDTTVGLVLTLLLRRAGYDPLLANGTERPLSSRVAHLSPPAVRTLAALGVPVREWSTAVNSVSVRTAASQDERSVALSWETGDAKTPSVVVCRKRLHNALLERLPTEQRSTGRTVERVTRRDSGLRAEFENGIREWFDVAVDAGGGGHSLRSVRSDTPTVRTLVQCEFLTENVTPAQHHLYDRWRSDAFVQQLPVPSGTGHLRRVTAPQSDIGTVFREESWVAARPNGGATDTAGDVERDEVRVRQIQPHEGDARPIWWGTGRVAFCGQAACPVAPASGFDPTLGIEDAVAFVSELTSARPVADVVEAYSDGRAHRLGTLRQAVEAGHSAQAYPVQQSVRSPLASLAAFRAVSLGSVLGGPLSALQRDGFDPA
jgi:2-polyprenyl-6-methoxyphenol hydroxylase-like FAD-dependent oxidoreductase